LKVGFTSNSNYNINEGSQVGLFGILSASPIINPFNADGTTKRNVSSASGDMFVLTKDIVKNLSDNGLWLNETRGFATYNAFYGELAIPGIEGLKARTNLGLDFIYSNNGNFTGQGVNS